MDLVEKLVYFSKLIWDRKLTESIGGNFSIRFNDRIYITPTTFLKTLIEKKDIVTIDVNGKVIEGSRKPSSEWRMHALIYKTRPEINSVIHAHPPYSTLFAINGEEIPIYLTPESQIYLKKIYYTTYETPGTDRFAQKLLSGLKNGADIFILKNHGVTVIAENIEMAFAKLEMLEFICKLGFLLKNPRNFYVYDENLEVV
ncbi:class II aldolase/adducin family protein [Thermosipho atlanticus]|uniref:L-fuculose-phosphate aldolase n=1 Tax=Thermosipho atlanticus DSM 15807 TaxID=1123380 RepID=A0A1M5TVS5_9BACT|nr:class II aldolase/adducin family protein [Thermosipho atlanticus]SHH54730.1 L-fuculose-phosphate aldolase [Thermosipho atlanticus DSM 15807]